MPTGHTLPRPPGDRVRQSRLVWWVALVAALGLSAASCGDNHGAKGAAGKAVHARAGDGGAVYGEGTEGLEQLFRDLLAAVEDHDRKRAAALIGGLELKDPKAWFRRTFGESLGAKLAAEYAPTVGNFDQLEPVLAGLVAEHETDLTVESFAKPGDPEATGYQNLALTAMVQPAPLYSVRLSTAGEDNAFHIWSFVYDAGYFRWVGKMRAVNSGEPSDPDLLELRTRLARVAAQNEKDK